MNAPNRSRASAITVALALSLSATGAAQQDQKDPKQSPPPAAATTKLTDWPKLADTDKERILGLVGQFRKADPQLHESATKGLLAMGAGAAPMLFQQVADRPENINTQLFTVFDTMLEPAHAALMARELKKPRVELRRYLVTRLCRFTDPEMLPVLQASMTDKDELTAFHAALGALALKHKDALAPVTNYARNHWLEIAKIVGEVLPAARGKEAGGWVIDAIAKAPVADQMTGLRLLRSLAVKEQITTLRAYLTATDHAVKREAVNLMRVLHGEQPAENLPVFQVIEQANAWLKKV